MWHLSSLQECHLRGRRQLDGGPVASRDGGAEPSHAARSSEVWAFGFLRAVGDDEDKSSDVKSFRAVS